MGKGARLAALHSQATMIEGDPKIRAKKCLAEIQVILQAYRCRMYGECTVSPHGVKSAVQIEPIVDQEVPSGIITPN